MATSVSDHLMGGDSSPRPSTVTGSLIDSDAATSPDETDRALQDAYDLIMLLAFAKPDAETGVPKTFAVLDALRAALKARVALRERDAHP